MKLRMIVWLLSLVFVLVVFSVWLLPSIESSSKICSFKGPDVLYDMSLTNFEISGDLPVRVGDTVVVEFEWTPQKDVVLGSDGIFGGVYVSGLDEGQFGNMLRNQEIDAWDKQEFLYNATFPLNGTWEIWPSFHLNNDSQDLYGFSFWHTCSIEVLMLEGGETDPPTIEFSYSPPVLTTESGAILRTDVSDPSGVKNISIELDGQLVEECVASPCVYDAGNLSQGIHSVRILAYDTLDNAGELTENFEVQSTDPTLPDPPSVSASHAPASVTEHQQITFSASAVKGEYDISKMEIWIEGAKARECLTDTCEYVGGPYPPGQVSYIAYAYDVYNKSGSSGIQHVNVSDIDESVPQLHSFRVVPGTPRLGSRIRFFVSARDDSEIDLIELYVDDLIVGSCFNFNSIYGECDVIVPMQNLGDHNFSALLVDNFGNSVTVSEIVEVASCADGIQNADEEGVDCGGVWCPDCGNCETGTKWAPDDSVCTEAWPTDQGPALTAGWRNPDRQEHTCHIYEVCNQDLDYILEDAINCCESPDYRDFLDPPRELGKEDACTAARGQSIGMDLTPERFQECTARYLIHSFGWASVYMQAYFNGEFCCKNVAKWCPDVENNRLTCDPAPWDLPYNPRVMTYDPVPDHDMNELWCMYDVETSYHWEDIIFIRKQITYHPLSGWWNSDEDMSQNNCGAYDAPAHVSINEYSTGTCRDYAIALTTMLRKAGFGKDDVLTVSGNGHGYNLLRLPRFNRFYYVDDVGNTGGGIKHNPATGYDYCRNMSHGCANDFYASSTDNCPGNVEIHGCRNIVRDDERE